MVVDLQRVAVGAGLQHVVARRVETQGPEIDPRRAPGGHVDLLPVGAAAIDQQLDTLAVPLLSAEVLQFGVQAEAAAHGYDRLGRSEGREGQVLDRRLAHVDHDRLGGGRQLGALPAEAGRGGRGQSRGPRDPLQIGQEVDHVPVQVGAVAVGSRQQLADFGQRGRQVGPGVLHLDVFDLLADGRRLEGRRAHHYPRRRSHQYQREGVAGGTLVHDAGRQLLGPLQPALVRGPVGHGIGDVDDQQAMGPPAGEHSRAGALDRRLGHRQHHQHDDQRAQRQQQPLLDANLARLPLQGRQQVFHGGPGCLLIPPPAEQVHQQGAAAAASHPSRAGWATLSAKIGGRRGIGIRGYRLDAR